jgi:hypothetical protein
MPNHRRVSRRTALKLGAGALVAGGVAAAAPLAFADSDSRQNIPGAALATKLGNLSGPNETGPFQAPWSDLGIPARCPDGSMLFVGGDTFNGDHVPNKGEAPNDWRCPVGFRSSNSDVNNLRIDGSVGGDHAVSLVDEPHNPVGDGATTAIPSDVFTIGDTMYMHLMRGVIYDTHHTDFWKSTDNGNTWQYLCQWPGDQYGGQFQQKTYAVADDGNCYVLSTVFNRGVDSGLLLHKVPQDQLGNPDAYVPWGFDGGWDWGHPPTTINGTRRWGEICFRAMDGKYALTWLNMDPLGIHAQVFPLPTADLTRTREQYLILPTNPGAEIANLVASPYGGFIVPGSTFADFHIIVSQWYDNTNYRFMHYRLNGVSS